MNFSKLLRFFGVIRCKTIATADNLDERGRTCCAPSHFEEAVMAQVVSDPLPAETCSVEAAARRLGLSRSAAYALARQDALPVPVLRLGRKLVIPVRSLDRILGVVDPVAQDNASIAPAESTPRAPASSAA